VRGVAVRVAVAGRPGRVPREPCPDTLLEVGRQRRGLFPAGHQFGLDVGEERLPQLAVGAPPPPVPADSPKLSASFITGIKKGFTEYFSKLEQGGGEDMEGRNVVRLRNPFSTHIGDDIIKGPPDQIFVKDASKVRSSWNDVKSPNFVDQGRNGYSVKIVPLQLLNKPSDVSPNNGNARIKNPPVSSDNEMQEDFDLIQH
jgi:hypothetical protein